MWAGVVMASYRDSRWWRREYRGPNRPYLLQNLLPLPVDGGPLSRPPLLSSSSSPEYFVFYYSFYCVGPGDHQSVFYLRIFIFAEKVGVPHSRTCSQPFFGDMGLLATPAQGQMTNKRLGLHLRTA